MKFSGCSHPPNVYSLIASAPSEPDYAAVNRNWVTLPSPPDASICVPAPIVR